MSISDASILGEGLGLGGGRDTAGRYVRERESWPHALFSLRLSGRQAAKSRAVPLRIRTCGSLRESLYPTLYTLSISTVDFYILFITLRVVSQFLYTTGKSEQKLVSRFLFLDF